MRHTEDVTGIVRMGDDESLIYTSIREAEVYNIEVYKIYKGRDNLDIGKLFEMAHSPPRRHLLKLIKHCCHLDCRKFFFSHRIINVWNASDEKVLACDSTDGLKNGFHTFLCS